jgi:hypothetical protein
MPRVTEFRWRKDYLASVKILTWLFALQNSARSRFDVFPTFAGAEVGIPPKM